mmetsp:Transcript_20270/g.43940  ORF Transcript_20270/g.43940 Transcript_20270/m.43940 type:complete len:177 (-) Transcript_20270:214-744(-)
MAPPPPPLPALPGADASGADASGALDLFSSGAYRPPSDELDAMLAELLRGPPRSAQAQEAVAHVCAASAALCDGGIQPPAHSGASLLLLLIPFALGCTAGAACGLLCRRAPKRAARKQDSRTTPLDSPRDSRWAGDENDGFSQSGGTSFLRGKRRTPLAHADAASFDMETYPVVIE